jgi:hypothetical protein
MSSTQKVRSSRFTQQHLLSRTTGCEVETDPLQIRFPCVVANEWCGHQMVHREEPEVPFWAWKTAVHKSNGGTDDNGDEGICRAYQENWDTQVCHLIDHAGDGPAYFQKQFVEKAFFEIPQTGAVSLAITDRTFNATILKSFLYRWMDTQQVVIPPPPFRKLKETYRGKFALIVRRCGHDH